MSAVIVQLPPDAGNGLQISVSTDEDGRAEVLVRAASHHQWMPISHIEGHVEVRP